MFRRKGQGAEEIWTRVFGKEGAKKEANEKAKAPSFRLHGPQPLRRNLQTAKELDRLPGLPGTRPMTGLISVCHCTLRHGQQVKKKVKEQPSVQFAPS